MLDRVLEYACEHVAIGAVPTDDIDRAAVHYAVGDDTGFAPHPLTAHQVAALAGKVGERYGVYGLLVLRRTPPTRGGGAGAGGPLRHVDDDQRRHS